ncbi:MAG: aldo/keto reductase [Gemmatimonadetes bacterium]|nr:aldo/keto reductase [Gemmatimonadota bacterium]
MIERTELAPGYAISRLVHGGWQFSSGHRLSDAQLDDAVGVLMASADLGVTTFDCADIYTGVEELYGRFLRAWSEEGTGASIQIHTKFVPDYSDLPDVDRGYVRRIVHRSLARLGVERVDLVQFYWWREEVPGMEDAASWLAELRDEGKIRHVAVTNMDAARLARIRDTGVEVVSNQVQYSLLDRRVEGPLAARCAETGMRLVAFGTLAGGFLTDRWLGKSDPARGGKLGDLANRSLVKYRLIIEEFGGWDAYQALLETLADIARACGVEISAVAVRFVLDQPHVAAVIAGATRMGQMSRNAVAFRVRLDASDHARIRALTDAAPGPAGDVFELERDREGPHGRIMKYDLNRTTG